MRYLFILFVLLACSKDEDDCYKCTTVTQTASNPRSPQTSESVHCGMTDKAIKEVEKNGTTTTTKYNSRTSCQKL